MFELEGEFLKAYSIKEVSNKIEVTEGTIRQWEKDFNLDLPRNEENARYFTEIEIETLEHIKMMRDKNLSKVVIKDLLDKREADSAQTQITPILPQLRQTEVTETLRSIQRSFEAFPEIKEQVISELKEEVKESMRNELEENFEKQNKILEDKLENITKAQKELEENQKEEKNKGFFARLFNK